VLLLVGIVVPCAVTKDNSLIKFRIHFPHFNAINIQYHPLEGFLGEFPEFEHIEGDLETKSSLKFHSLIRRSCFGSSGV